MIESKYESHKPSYYKVWDSKQKAIRKMFGNWEESYQRLQKLLMTYIDQDPTTQVIYRTAPTSEDDTVFLHYVFWSFGPCIDRFKYCKSVISIDGTYLYGKYQEKLLVIMATDANNKVFPFAFVVVDCESRSSWRWFLQCLRDTIDHMIPDEDICIISDRNLELDSKVSSVESGICYSGSKIDTIMESIKQVEIEAIMNKKKVMGKDSKEKDFLPYTYLVSKSVDMWTQSHDGGKYFGVMTTNISKCFNGVLKGARGLPIAAMIKFTWSKLVEYFYNRHKEITYKLLEGKKLSTYAFSM
ncbi:uncharacterized protein LOC115956658 [Quercus lobata]|uniref:uncharacterized protein LOC115956658 n=1 Tax=Quercus lobata TaxID=97700 RepID=UPI001249041C|nr:uncharacterized protein LOC115956658 [Quercus lobata]